jgi:hypothetical protein
MSSEAQSSSGAPPVKESGPELKYLGFFRLYAIKLAAYFQSLYKHGKSAVPQAQPYFESVESTAWKYLKPVYEATEDKPQKLLVFADKKVDQTLKTVESYHGYWRKSGNYALGLVGKARDAAFDTVGVGKQVVTDVQEHGPVEAAKAYYGKYEPWVEKKAYGLWKFGLGFPLVPQAVELAFPVAKFGAEMYNDVVGTIKDANYPVVKPLFELFPLVPIDKVEKTVKSDTKEAISTKSS